MSWHWIAIALTVPTGLAILVTLLYSVRGDPAIGAILGSGVVFASCVGLIGRGSAELARLSQSCLGIGCRVYSRASYAVRYLCLHRTLGSICSLPAQPVD